MHDALTSRTIRAALAGRDLRDRLFALYDAAYAGGSREEFEADLAEKDWIILLEAGGDIAGFSTQKVFEITHEGKRLRILFSGDTIIDPRYWGSQELVRAWCRFAGRMKGEEPQTTLYWFLISKGHRTYLYLPLFFRSFYPSCDEPTPPFAEELMKLLGTSRYGGRYDPATGLIDSTTPRDRLRGELDSAAQRNANRHVAFFLERNPRYAEGVELLCLTDISPENMRSFARREVERGMAEVETRHHLRSAARDWIEAASSDAARFAGALEHPRQAQEEILLRTVARNAGSPYGRRHRFSSISSIADYQRLVPLVTWDDIAADAAAGCLTADPPLMYETTSGSAGAAKRIPYTAALRDEFMAALAPWMHDLYGSRPHLRGSAYWSVSPVTSTRGFVDDRDYFAGAARTALDAILTLPPATARIADLDTSRYVTLRFLLADRNLSLISVWNPSFLTILMRELDRWKEQLVADIANGTLSPPADLDPDIRLALQSSLGADRERARELEVARAPTEMWPDLTLISCWCDAAAALAFPALSHLFEGVEIQPKGLIATEGVVSIPYGRGAGCVLAVRSHFFEFRDRDSGAISLAGDLRDGREYDVILTTGGGLYRYLLGDVVRVTGRTATTERVTFVGRVDDVCDIAGEKLSEAFVRSTFEAAGAPPGFLFLAPEWRDGTPGYTLFTDAGLGVEELQAFVQRVDRALSENPHYRFCRESGQLAPLRAVLLQPGATDLYLRIRAADGRIGDVKPRALEREFGWGERLRTVEAVA